MKVKELEQESIKEVSEDTKKIVKSTIKTYRREIRMTKKALLELEQNYSEFLNKDIEEIEDDDFEY